MYIVLFNCRFIISSYHSPAKANLTNAFRIFGFLRSVSFSVWFWCCRFLGLVPFHGLSYADWAGGCTGGHWLTAMLVGLKGVQRRLEHRVVGSDYMHTWLVGVKGKVTSLMRRQGFKRKQLETSIIRSSLWLFYYLQYQFVLMISLSCFMLCALKAICFVHRLENDYLNSIKKTYWNLSNKDILVTNYSNLSEKTGDKLVHTRALGQERPSQKMNRRRRKGEIENLSLTTKTDNDKK